MLTTRTHSHKPAHMIALSLCALVLIAIVSAGCGATRTSRPTPAKVTVTLTSPTHGSRTTADHVTVRGTVTPVDAVVEIQGQPAAVGNGVFTGTATVHHGRTTIDVIGSAPGATPAATSIAITRPTPHVKHHATRTVVVHTIRSVVHVPSSPVASSSGGNCGDGLSVGVNTTCPFAENVRAAYDESGPGTVNVYSPVTGNTYAMTCSPGTPVVCTGGNDASVSFYGRPTASATAAAAHASTGWGEKSCGAGLAVGPNTTCPFAENVRSAYENAGPGTVSVYSPVTGRTYTMTCISGDPVVCTGANQASVYFS